MADKFVYTWDSGYITEFSLPSKKVNCDSDYSSKITSHNTARVNLINGASDPTADIESVGFLTDKLGYLTDAYNTAVAEWNNAKGILNFWKNTYDWCRGCCSGLIGCVAQCTCNKNSGACYKTESNLDSERDKWGKVVTQWKQVVSDLQDLTTKTNEALAKVNLQIQTEIEQANQQALTNEIIAETNIIIAMAKGKELEVEETDRISKFFTIIVPIVVLILLIVMIQIWRKK